MTGDAKRCPRVFVLALDGATFDLLRPWMAEGRLPNLGRLYGLGAHGFLRSTYPPLTAPAWASFITGKSPENHGLLEFFRRRPGSYQLGLNSRLDVDGQSIWRVLSDAGKRVGVVSVPLTWPPEPVSGFLITGLLTPRRDDVVFTYPPELGEELRRKLGRYLLQHSEKYLQDEPGRLVRDELAIMGNRFDAALYLLEAKPWDFFMLHLLGGDVLQHGFWQYMDPNHPEYSQEGQARYGEVIRDFYTRVDARLGEVLAHLPHGTHTVVMSDHGFGPLKKYINFNTWLLDQGFIKLRRNLWTQLRYLAFRLGYHYRLAWEVASRVGLVRLVIRMGRDKQEQAQRRLFLSLNDVDWSRTSVYSVGNFGQMFVNLRGREPDGCVEPGEHFEAVLAQLETALRELRDPDTGEPVIGEVWRGSELWRGRYADQAPDLFFFTRDMQYKAMGLSDFGSNRVFEGLYGTHAHHRMDGVLILTGPGIRPNFEIHGARLEDLAPTIYHLLGVPVPGDLDGRVLADAFVSPPVIREAAVSDGRERAKARATSGYTEEEEAELAKHLRDLGYVS